MSLEDVARFWEWFDQTRGDLSVMQIERQAHCPRGRIGNAYSLRKEPTAMVCTSIADGLGITKEDVFRRAGLLPPLPTPEEKQDEQELVHTYRSLVDQLKPYALSVLHALAGAPAPANQVSETRAAYQVDDQPRTLTEHLAHDIATQLDTMTPEDQTRVIDLMRRLSGSQRGETEDVPNGPLDPN